MAPELMYTPHYLPDRMSDLPLMKSQGSGTCRHIPLHAMTIGWGHSRERGVQYDWDGTRRGTAAFAVFQYTLSGSGELRYEDATYRLARGSAMLVHVPHDHRYRLPADADEWHFAYACFNGSEVLRILSAVERNNGPVFELAPNAAAVQTLRRVLQLNTDYERNSPFELSRLAYEFALSLMEDTIALASSDGQPTWLERVKRYAEAHLEDELSVSDLASVAGYSRFHFTHIFARYEKQAPQEYLSTLRIWRAKELLSAPELAVKEIAARCGFSDASYFCRQFRKSVGLSPGEYRKKIRNERLITFHALDTPSASEAPHGIE